MISSHVIGGYGRNYGWPPSLAHPENARKRLRPSEAPLVFNAQPLQMIAVVLGGLLKIADYPTHEFVFVGEPFADGRQEFLSGAWRHERVLVDLKHAKAMIYVRDQLENGRWIFKFLIRNAL
jgi:hypothetical protein